MVQLLDEVWAVVSPGGEVITDTIAYTRTEAINKLCNAGADWESLRRKRGFRVVRIRIEVLEPVAQKPLSGEERHELLADLTRKSAEYGLEF